VAFGNVPRVPDQLVRLDHDGPLAVITIEQPPLNLFDETLVAAFAAAITAVAASDARGLLVRAEGRHVSAGVDVHLFAGLTPERATQLWVEWFAMIHALGLVPEELVQAVRSARRRAPA